MRVPEDVTPPYWLVDVDLNGQEVRHDLDEAIGINNNQSLEKIYLPLILVK